MKNACSNKYQYYHLLSGVDFPLKNQNEINAFFDLNCGKEFVSVDQQAVETLGCVDRIQYYWIFQNLVGRNQTLLGKICRKMELYFIKIQKLIKIDRTRYLQVKQYKGDNWFSITDNCARYILLNKESIRKHYRFTKCADEMFLQNVIMSSPLKAKVVGNSLREIDWKRGMPYTYQEDDYEVLIRSNKIFARKFSYETGRKIVDMINAHIKQSSNGLIE